LHLLMHGRGKGLIPPGRPGGLVYADFFFFFVDVSGSGFVDELGGIIRGIVKLLLTLLVHVESPHRSDSSWTLYGWITGLKVRG
jgi:hypothetical protein